MEPGEDDASSGAGADPSNLACSPSVEKVGASSSALPSVATCSSAYGVDRSFPIHHADSFAVTEADAAHDGNDPFDREAKKSFYRSFMAGCYEKYEAYDCDASEAEMMDLNLRQPASMNVSESSDAVKIGSVASCLYDLCSLVNGIVILLLNVSVSC